MTPGRSCPPQYGYSPKVFARAADFSADTLYVIGGLYGNPQALDTIDELAREETQAPTRVFNGDFHWFDTDPALFARLQQRVLAHVALRGNVETEIASDDGAAGCGCAYPESVPDADVERSNGILVRLRATACEVPGARAELASLPMHAVAQVGALRIGIVHGDAWSLAGWRFAQDSVHNSGNDLLVERSFELGAVDGYACSHTCLPALRAYRRGFVINNGAAGMANFAGSAYGILTRISRCALPAALSARRLFGLFDRDVWIDALRIDFDLSLWLPLFDRLWPAGSPAAVSYRNRIRFGTDCSPAQALGRAPTTAACSTAG